VSSFIKPEQLLTGLADAQLRMGQTHSHVVTVIVKITDWDNDSITYRCFSSAPPDRDDPFTTSTHAEVAFMTWFYSEYLPHDANSYGGFCDIFLRFTPCTVNDGTHKSADQWGKTGGNCPLGCHEKLVELANAYPNFTFRVFSLAQYDPTGVQKNINGKGPYNPMLFHYSDATASNLKMEIRSLEDCRKIISMA